MIRPRRPPVRGQSLLEYAIVAALLAGALFVVEYDGRTGAQYLAEMIRLTFRSFSYYLSLP